MSYYSNYESYQPLVFKSDDDDVPMILHERHIQSVSYALQECFEDSSNLVLQDESEDETDEEEEEDEFTNYPHGTSHLVLQDLLTFEPELMEDSDDELYALLGLDDGEFQELRNSENEMMTEEELLESIELKMDESHPLVEEVERLRDDDMLCLSTSPEASLTVSNDLASLKDIDKLKIDMDRGIWSRLAPNMGITTHVGSDIYGLLDDPGGVKMSISFSLVMANGRFLQSYWGIILLINKPPENKWRIDVHITTLKGEMFYRKDIKNDNILPCEYDWKGNGVVILDPP